MDGAGFGADDEGWFLPGLSAEGFGEIVSLHHSKEGDERGVSLAEEDGAFANDDEACGVSSGSDAGELLGFVGKDAGEESPWSEMPCCGEAVVGDAAAQFKAAGKFLGMFTDDASLDRPIGWAAGDEIKFLILAQHAGIAEVPVAHLISVRQSIGDGGSLCEGDTFLLCLHGDKPRARTTPGTDHADGADATAEVQSSANGGCPGGAIPRRQNIIGGKPVAVFQLEQAEVAADGIARFTFGWLWIAGRDGTGFGPALEMRCWRIHHA